MSAPSLSVLIVEDSDSDVELIEEALSAWKQPPIVTAAKDGETAIQLLTIAVQGLGMRIPDLVLLDLNLPKCDGLDVLRAIRSMPALAMVPVIVLSTSDRERDVRTAYSLHANAYLTKPIEFDLFIERVKAVEEFWGRHARLLKHHVAPLGT